MKSFLVGSLILMATTSFGYASDRCGLRTPQQHPSIITDILDTKGFHFIGNADTDFELNYKLYRTGDMYNPLKFHAVVEILQNGKPVARRHSFVRSLVRMDFGDRDSERYKRALKKALVRLPICIDGQLIGN